jgi:hypothetical protein
MTIETPDNKQSGQSSNAGQGSTQSTGAGFSASRGNESKQSQPGRGNMSTPQQDAPAGFSFRSMGRLANAPMGRNPASEVLVKLDKAMTEIYKGANPSFEIKLIPLDMNNNPAIARSALIVAMFDRNSQDLGVAYHTLIVAGSGEPFPPKYEQINGQNIEIMRLDCEVWDDKFREVAADAVARTFPGARLVDAEATVVPRDFSIADEQLVYQLAANSLFAAAHELDRGRSDFHDLNLAGAAKDSNLTARVQFNHDQLVDPVGEPIRTDVLIELIATAAQQGSGANADARATKVSQVGGFLDLVWDPVNPQGNPYGNWGQQQQQFSPLYVTHFIMTHLECMELMTVPAQLFALVQAMMLRDGNAWARGFAPRPYSQGIDMHDIGAIGIEANPEGNANGIGARIDTKSDSFAQQGTLNKILQAFVRPGLLMSIDVPECGPSTWSNSVFAAAAEGNSRANAFIIEAAQHLTNGNFGKNYQGSGRVAFDNQTRIHNGWYIDSNGRKCDLRNIDYLAVANMIGEKDPTVIKDWSDSFVNLQIPAAQRLARRKAIIQALVGDATFTGFSRRATLAGDFMEALAKGCLDTGLQLRAQYPFGDIAGQERATAQFANGLLMAPGATGLFSSGFGGGAAQGGGWRSNFGSRW